VPACTWAPEDRTWLPALKVSAVEVKLYRSTKDTRWFAFGSKIGWVMFPAEVAGWNKPQRTCGADLIDMREVPLCMGLNTGLPGASMSASAASACGSWKWTSRSTRRARSPASHSSSRGALVVVVFNLWTSPLWRSRRRSVCDEGPGG
jgi:hypothetical protein